MNCWEVLHCGKEKLCPAYPDNGKICFSIEKTVCRGEIQGDYFNKREKCQDCEYYQKFILKK